MEKTIEYLRKITIQPELGLILDPAWRISRGNN